VTAAIKVNQCCPSCGSTSIDDAKRYTGHEILRCLKCSLLFEKNIPSPEELRSHYALYPYAFLRETPQSVLDSYRQVLKFLVSGLESPKLLDYGCGQGSFLAECRRQGIDAVGLEYSPSARSLCEQQDLKVVSDVEGCLELYPEGFDIITSFEVVEHFSQPKSMLDECHGCLKPGGLLYITTPNSSSISLHLMRGDSPMLGYPDHLCLFNAKSISELARLVGFNVVKAWSTGLSVSQVKQKLLSPCLPNTSGSQGFSEACADDLRLNQKLSSNPGGKFAKKLANRLLSLFGVGDTLKVLLKKRKP